MTAVYGLCDVNTHRNQGITVTLSTKTPMYRRIHNPGNKGQMTVTITISIL